MADVNDPGRAVDDLSPEQGRDGERGRLELEAVLHDVDPADPVASVLRAGGYGRTGIPPARDLPRGILRAASDQRELLAALGEVTELGRQPVECRREAVERFAESGSRHGGVAGEFAREVACGKAQLLQRGKQVARSVREWGCRARPCERRLPRRGVVIPNGIDLDLFSPGSREVARQQLGWDQGEV